MPHSVSHFAQSPLENATFIDVEVRDHFPVELLPRGINFRAQDQAFFRCDDPHDPPVIGVAGPFNEPCLFERPESHGHCRPAHSGMLGEFALAERSTGPEGFQDHFLTEVQSEITK